MSLWSNTDANTGAPKYAAAGGLGVSANGSTLYGNTTSGAYVTGAAVGVFGVSAAETLNTTGEGPKVSHAGWNLRKAGTGPVETITITGGNADYRTGGFIAFTGGGGGGANASYTVNTTTNTINSITLVNGGLGYLSAPTATAANANGATTLTCAVTVGGRAGRVQYECLVAMGSQNDGTSDDAVLPQ
jgi:hypothetical protein